jgi:hypothetical protein
MLVTLDFKKKFIIYCYAFEYMLSGILTQKNNQGTESPTMFMIAPLKKHESLEEIYLAKKIFDPCSIH